ncbi:sulfatase-like hydrolase/transferase [Novosphingobium sp. Gsoil 351]|nr:sulfatase-like hydrolase/transferase [Novosphingobium sp. Gsoil 351]
MIVIRSARARMRRMALVAGTLATGLFAPQPVLARADAAARPNVIVIVTDDQGYRDVGFNGSPDIPTPNIDRIAREGVRFTRGYVAFPVCAPSRAGLLTGRYPARFGFDRNPNGDPADPKGGVPRTELMLPEAMKAAGYATKAIGKWHLGTHPTLRPRVRGFDEFYGFIEGGHQYFPGLSRMNDISQSKVTYDWYYSKLTDNGVAVEFKKYLTEGILRPCGRIRRSDDDGRQAVLSLPGIQCPPRTAAGDREVPRPLPASEGSQAARLHGDDQRGRRRGRAGARRARSSRDRQGYRSVLPVGQRRGSHP